MPNRTSPRHPSFDYRTRAAYFVTICTYERRCLFGTVQKGRMVLKWTGQIVVEEWCRSEEIRDEVLLDTFVVMPDHMHGIVCLVPPDVNDVSPRGYDLHVGSSPLTTAHSSADGVRGTHGEVSLDDGSNRLRWQDGRPRRRSGSLGSMIAGFKGAVTTRINKKRGTPGAPVWQSRYHDRILYNELAWRVCRRYIQQNPSRWHRDRN